MTNVLQPIGFQFARNKVNAGSQHNEYRIAAANTELIGIGDLVRMNNSANIVKCAANVTPIGIFQGWQISTRPGGGGSQGGGGNDGSVPFKKAWTGAQTSVLPTNAGIRCIIEDDPNLMLIAQSRGTITRDHIGLLVDMSDAPGGPDVSLFGRSKQKVTCPTTYYNITAITVDTGGSGFTQGGVDLVVDDVIEDLLPNDITVSGGAVTTITLLNPIVGLVDNTPVIELQAKPGYSGTGPGTFTPTVSGAQTANQFRIEQVVEKPFRAFDSSFNTTGYDLSAAGLYAWVVLSYARHMRAGTALYGAVAS